MLLIAAISFAASSQVRHLSDLPKPAQVSILDQRASEYHTAGDILSVSGAVIALSSLQHNTLASDERARIFAGAALIGVGRLVHLLGSHAERRANKIRFSPNGLSFNF